MFCLTACLGDQAAAERRYVSESSRSTERKIVSRRVRFPGHAQLPGRMAQRRPVRSGARPAPRRRAAWRRNMKSRGGTGRIKINHADHVLGLCVRTGRGAQEVTDLKAISGGERSFVTAAFITALAKIVSAPFYCLDEVRPRPGLAWAGCIFMTPGVIAPRQGRRPRCHTA